MSDNDEKLYLIDPDEIRRLRERRGLDRATAARLTHTHERLWDRLEDPEREINGCPAHRRSKAKARTVRMIAQLLKVDPAAIAQDYPIPVPEPNPPEPPPGPPTGAALADWRSRRNLADVRRARWQLAMPDADEVA
jgi:hypothetical protein